MTRKSRLVFGGLFVLAVAFTVGLFTFGSSSGSGDDKPASGKLSPDVVKVERDFNALLKAWKEKEPSFKLGKSATMTDLTDVHNGFKRVAKEAKALAGASDVERAALPHLVTATREASLVPEVYAFLVFNPTLATKEKWDEKNGHMEAANKAWREWEAATTDLSR